LPLDIEHQLEIARALATLDARRPRETSLRRAVSTAYYALFQALCKTCADVLVGWRNPWESYTPIFRTLQHQGVAQALKPNNWLDAPQVQRLGLAFAELQTAREWADYNPEPRPDYDKVRNNAQFARPEALRLIDLADSAIRILNGADDQTRLRLVTRLVAKSRR
jgi:hypothetical protein